MQLQAQQDVGDPRSLLEPLREVQERLRLEVEETYTRQEEIREAADKQTARFTYVWYHRRGGSPEGAEKDVGGIIERLSDEVFENKPVAYAIVTDPRTRDTSQTMVSIRWTEGYEPKAAARPELEAVDPYRFSISVGESDYSIGTEHGTTFEVQRNGETVESECASAAHALGKLIKHLLIDITEIDEARGNHDAADDADRDFLLGLAPDIASSPIVSEEARKHLVDFVELVTNKDLAAESEEE